MTTPYGRLVELGYTQLAERHNLETVMFHPIRLSGQPGLLARANHFFSVGGLYSLALLPGTPYFIEAPPAKSEKESATP